MDGLFKRLKGFADLHGEEGAKFYRMEEEARKIFGLYMFEELRTPVLEQTALFKRSIGDSTDVVQKEMFTFVDSKDRSMTLRPEATAGVLRAVIEEDLARDGQIGRFYTIGPMFRHERPQKGRMRQFHQINCECLGTDSPYADASLICMLLDFLKSLEIGGLRLKINSLGCKKCRKEYLDKLRDFYAGHEQEDFCPDCRSRMQSNPLRVLDCKNVACQEKLLDAPAFVDHLCDECKSHFARVRDLLQKENIKFEIDNHLVRGLDYYVRTTFEVVSDRIGAQTAVAGGGRYDGLISALGGPDMPGVGFACGMERLALHMEPQKKARPDFFFLTPDAEERDLAFVLAEKLRKLGLAGEMNYIDASFKSLMRQAARQRARYCLILGSDEAEKKAVTVKDMESGEQKLVPQDLLTDFLVRETVEPGR